MAVQRYDLQKPSEEAFEERYWSPINSPVFGPDGKLEYIIHRVEDVTEFIRLRRHGTEQERLAEEMRQRAHRMEMDVFLRAQEIQELNRRLESANEALKSLDRAKNAFLAGSEFLTKLKTQQPKVKVLLTSGYSESEARQLCAANTGAAFMQKPYTAQHFLGAVEALLKRSLLFRSGVQCVPPSGPASEPLGKVPGR